MQINRNCMRIIVFILLAFFLAGCAPCNNEDLSGCDRSCKEDSDCVCSCAMGCFNKDETIPTPDALCDSGPDQPYCDDGECKGRWPSEEES